MPDQDRVGRKKPRPWANPARAARRHPAPVTAADNRATPTGASHQMSCVGNAWAVVQPEIAATTMVTRLVARAREEVDTRPR